jgi:hypothetical protein
MVDLKTLPDDAEQLKKIISTLLDDVNARDRRIGLLLEEIDLWKKRLFAPKTERFTGEEHGQQNLFNETEKETDMKTCGKREDPCLGLYEDKKRTHQASSSLPREIVDIDIEKKDKTCAAGKPRTLSSRLK